MLITPRTYSTSQTPDRGFNPPTSENQLTFYSLSGWCANSANAEMLLLHQAGSVRVGEVVRYTLTYTPATDPIQPIPEKLYIKVKNTSAIPLRAAYLHGPYTLYASCYPSKFDPNLKYEQQETEGTPEFEPYIKAGGNWNSTITVPQRLRQPKEPTPVNPESCQSITWVIEIVSQVIFSSTAAVRFELLVGRDERSLALLSAGGATANGLPRPAQLDDHRSPKTKGKQVLATKGVYSKSIKLLIDDTVSLWNTPPFPSFSEENKAAKANRAQDGVSAAFGSPEECFSGPDSIPKNGELKKKKIHLVVLTHGLHSNLGADMLYLKESIDAAAKKAKEKVQRNREHSKKRHVSSDPSTSSRDRTNDYGAGNDANSDSDSDDEQVIVRGFPGNAVRTERGIQYLGKRLAKYVLLMTYPDQPYLPLKSTKGKSLSRPLAAWKSPAEQPINIPTATNPNEDHKDGQDHAYRVASISFIGHSLGGLVQTYAIAYIQKYSPQFFEMIKPINFIALATPFLGLSNENPVYVRFALDLGLVGRTGQDLGLSWTAPRMRSGWGAIIGGKGHTIKPQAHTDPGSKPLLRILPCGPAHEVLVKFKHRTIYSNVVNDGIVPLRTSCLLFLDWKGLDRVEKARRGNGIMGTMAEWGWAELTGANSKSPQATRPGAEVTLGDTNEESDYANKTTVTVTPWQSETPSNIIPTDAPPTPKPSQFLKQPHQSETGNITELSSKEVPAQSSPLGPLSSFFSIFRPKETKSSPGHKQTKIYKRSQTLCVSDGSIEAPLPSRSHPREALVRDNSYDEGGVHTPPKTTLFESASDLLMPPLPPIDFIVDPASRPRTIFHDRIYHPEDIPPPLPFKRRALTFGPSQSKNPPMHLPPSGESESGLKVEEKIARAYHRNLSWRKVLVRLEPDAHNNIIVRRMFTNAYGWPVVEHLVDTHFGHTSVDQPDEFVRRNTEKAKSSKIRTTGSGDVEGQTDPQVSCHNATSEIQETTDQRGFCITENLSRSHKERVAAVPVEEVTQNPLGVDMESDVSIVSGGDSARWCDHGFDDDDDDGESEFGEGEGGFDNLMIRIRNQ
ncbi:hypothetical protein ASPWEDRAFT_134166 [Aspergillus wentii DTO 134E9]|uniref:DUF676 domain-containing protein n=1 Tax=Aspergillus wentii DTO 134E9 TaxID=1073089 RepID=A0A1L9RLD4_ASPWE|nr:uncharacterized protein ASPWEDRAFT_134166 [Aspergillus wentii DTO 134E9]OJJ35749.1 hypothetical protein ASPWEDRAFT_134166 [Aspergillus wentii DTO 134E9]